MDDSCEVLLNTVSNRCKPFKVKDRKNNLDLKSTLSFSIEKKNARKHNLVVAKSLSDSKQKKSATDCPTPNIQVNSNLKLLATRKRNRVDNDEEENVHQKTPKHGHTLSSDSVNTVVNLQDLMSEPVDLRIEAVFSDCTFEKCGFLHPHLVASLKDNLKITMMTSIQYSALPVLMNYRDALLRAQTGSGKTLSYLVPMVQQLQAYKPALNRQAGVRALILLPTRELAAQTQVWLATILRPFVRIVSGLLTGGIRKKAQKASLRRGLNILVATPSRLLDHLRCTASLDLSRLLWLVIDEADRLVELGFENMVGEVVDHVRNQKKLAADTAEVGLELPRLQTVLLSATLSQGVERLAGLSLDNPAHVVVESSDLQTGDNSNFALPAGLKQYVLIVPLKLRLVVLVSFLLLKGKYARVAGKLIVFMDTQHTVDFHHRLLTETVCQPGPGEDSEAAETAAIAAKADLEAEEAITGQHEVQCWRLHGGMDHSARAAVFRAFSSCTSSGVLLCTDVAARGLDLPAVQWVLQFTPPSSPIDYVHRVGRTARAGSRGKALLLLGPHEASYVSLLHKKGVQLTPLQMKDITCGALTHLGIQNEERACESLQRQMEDVVMGDDVLRQLAERAFLSALRAYGSFSAEVRQLILFKLLHKGHLAKSFCLRDTPRTVSARAKAQFQQHDSVNSVTKEQFKKSERTSRVEHGYRVRCNTTDHAKQNMLSEFSSGL